jgi:hypothetical protein
MAICIYCAQAEGEYCIRNEAMGGDLPGHDICKDCSWLRVGALFGDYDEEHEHDSNCPCFVCQYYFLDFWVDYTQEEMDAPRSMQEMWEKAPEHLVRNFANRIEAIAKRVIDETIVIDPRQLSMFDDESPA